MGMKVPPGSVIRCKTADGSLVDVRVFGSIRDDGHMGIAMRAESGFRSGDRVLMRADGTVYPALRGEPERDYWLLSEATGEYHDHDTQSRVYVFSDGMRHMIPDQMAVAYKGILENIHVRKIGVDTGTLKNSWKPYTTASGMIGTIVFKTGRTWPTADEMRVIADTPPVDVEAAAKSLTFVMDKMSEWRTPREWLTHRVSEVAEQGRL